MHTLDAMYLQVLKGAILGDKNAEIEGLAWRFRRIIGPLVLLFDTLNFAALVHLVNLHDPPDTEDLSDSEDLDTTDNMRVKEEMSIVLKALQSVIDTPKEESAPIRLIHLSFRDFLLDSKRCTEGPFQIDEGATHKQLFEQCLNLMGSSLKRNICQLKAPGILMIDIPCDTVDQYLPQHVKYSCLYWVRHLTESKTELDEDNKDQILIFFQKHFLYWLEALALIQSLPESIYMLINLQSMISVSFIHIIYDLHKILF